jgi:hypothetical protein
MSFRRATTSGNSARCPPRGALASPIDGNLQRIDPSREHRVRLGSATPRRTALRMELRTKEVRLSGTSRRRLGLHLTVIDLPDRSATSRFERLSVALEQGHDPWMRKRGNELDHDVIRPRLTLRDDSGR